MVLRHSDKNEIIDVTPVTLNYINIIEIERIYSAKYIFERSCSSNGYGKPCLIFYQQILEDPSHSHYFGILATNNELIIFNANALIEGFILNCVKKDDYWIYSHHNHHFNPGSFVSIDGGQCYTRYVGDFENNEQLKSFYIEDGIFKEK